MEMIRVLADHSIRRALSFLALGVVTLMLALSYDLPLALRTGGNLLGLACLSLLFLAWRTPHRNVRHSELWSLLLEHAAPLVSSLTASEAQKRLSAMLRERLLWHAELVGGGALMLWIVSLTADMVLG
jgi:hypothetical protein